MVDENMIEAAGSDPNQSHIEDYFQTANEIDVLIHENDKLSNLLRQYEFNSTANYTQIEFNSFPNMLQHIICNAMKNAEKLPKGQRHLEILKKFATSLYLYRAFCIPFLAAECFTGVTIFKKYSKLHLFSIQCNQ